MFELSVAELAHESLDAGFTDSICLGGKRWQILFERLERPSWKTAVTLKTLLDVFRMVRNLNPDQDPGLPQLFRGGNEPAQGKGSHKSPKCSTSEPKG